MTAVPRIRPTVRVTDKYEAEPPDPGPGEHLWSVMALFRVPEPTADLVTLRHDDLLTISGPGCFKCHAVWTPEVAASLCLETTVL